MADSIDTNGMTPRQIAQARQARFKELLKAGTAVAWSGDEGHRPDALDDIVAGIAPVHVMGTPKERLGHHIAQRKAAAANAVAPKKLTVDEAQKALEEALEDDEHFDIEAEFDLDGPSEFSRGGEGQ